MDGIDTVRRNKTKLENILCADYGLILNKVDERGLITRREYTNLKSINSVDAWGHVVELVDKILNKGEDTCRAFLDLLHTDDDIKSAYPELRKLPWTPTHVSKPVQACSVDFCDDPSPKSKRQKLDQRYPVNSRPTGLCVIINNENFASLKQRMGTNKDAESLAEVFNWLGFRVLIFTDQTKDEMDQTLSYFSSLMDDSHLPEFSAKEWTNHGLVDIQAAPTHGDAFVCCILSHGQKGVVFGTDDEPLNIKHTIGRFKASNQPALTGKPKVFLIQACQGTQKQRGVLLENLQSDDGPSLSIPQEADFLIAMATVEDYASFRHRINGSWFIQSLCQQLKEGCPRGDDLTAILQRVNNDVSSKEATGLPGEQKQMPEVRFTLRKSLVFSPSH